MFCITYCTHTHTHTGAHTRTHTYAHAGTHAISHERTKNIPKCEHIRKQHNAGGFLHSNSLCRQGFCCTHHGQVKNKNYHPKDVSQACTPRYRPLCPTGRRGLRRHLFIDSEMAATKARAASQPHWASELLTETVPRQY